MSAGAILTIDDDPNARALLQVALRDGGYECLYAATGFEGVALAIECEPSVVLLDVALPDIDGVEVTRRIRERSRVPIIAVSARTHEFDKVAVLEAGSNDYMTKPFSTAELLARIRVALRGRAASEDAQLEGTITVGELTVDFDMRRVILGEKEVELSPIEYRLLGVMLRSRGRVLTNQHLLREVWGARYAGQVNYLRVYMNKLRHKIERCPAQPTLLVNEPGVGYRLRAN